MNILWFSHNVPYPPIGGTLQRNYNLLREVAKRFNVYLLAFNQRALLPTAREVQNAKTALEKLCVAVEVLPIPYESPQLGWYALVLKSLVTKDPYTVNWLKTSKMRQVLQRLVRNHRIDVAHYDTISLATYYHDTGSMPKVLSHQNVESSMMLRRARNESNALKKLYFSHEAKKLRQYEVRMCPQYEMNFVVSDLERDSLQRKVQNARIEVIANGVDLDYFRPDYEEVSGRGVVFAGRLDSYPNREAARVLLNQVWPALELEVPDAHLIIVGKNPSRELIERARRKSNVTVTGFVQDVRPYLEGSGVYVCPIYDGGGTRLKILDAMAMGKAIVSSSIGCEGIDVTPEWDILIANTTEQFVKQIKRVLNNGVLRKSLGRNARKLVEEKYSWKMIGYNLCRMYETLL